MSSPPSISFFLYNSNQPVTASHELWSAPLPTGPALPQTEGGRFTYGDYFTSAAGYLSKARFAPLRGALTCSGKDTESIRTVAIRLEKHGAFYHPAHITVQTFSGPVHLALNVAVSVPGRMQMDSELEALGRLAGGPAAADIPRVFHSGSFASQAASPVRMFLAEWFRGYSEFHMSTDPVSGQGKLELWDPETGNRSLTTRQTIDVFQGVARILTRCYNLDTAEQILSWHHAAGDFVVRADGSGVSVKLITVRQYGAEASLDIEDAEPASARLLNLFFFFLNLTLRNRLDRVDGAGEWVWAGREALTGTVRGFFAGLPAGEADRFRDWINGCRGEDFHSILTAILDSYHPEAPERPLLVHELKAHARDLEAVLAAERSAIE